MDEKDALDEPPMPMQAEDPTPPGAAAELDEVTELWQEVVADMEATAEEYRAEGWTAVAIHPGDVAIPTGRDGGRWGIEVLAPDDEFDEVEQLVEAGEFDECEVFRADDGGLVLLVVAMLDAATESAILIPSYYDPDRAREMLETARAEGEMRTHVRPLDGRTLVTFRHDDLDLFLPADEE